MFLLGRWKEMSQLMLCWSLPICRVMIWSRLQRSLPQSWNFPGLIFWHDYIQLLQGHMPNLVSRIYKPILVPVGLHVLMEPEAGSRGSFVPAGLPWVFWMLLNWGRASIVPISFDEKGWISFDIPTLDLLYIILIMRYGPGTQNRHFFYVISVKFS